jgi:DNA-directed RNA polymerase beta' subunit
LADYDGHSETERVLVDNEGLAILSQLKIQSVPLGNLGGAATTYPVSFEKWADPNILNSHCIYAATFDGDEMNMHMPQNVLAETELRHLAAIPYQMISPANNSPIIGIFQDSLLGSYRITRSTVSFTPRDAMNLLMMYPKVDTKALREAATQGKSKKSQGKLTSFDVLSQITPPLTMIYKTKLFEDGEDYATSNNGKYIRGQLEKSVLGSTSKGILHRICNDFGNMACANYNDDLQNIITEYMKSSSYSVGISDLIADKTTQQKISQVILTQKSEVQALVDKVHLGTFENNTANTSNAEFESSVNNILNKATEQAGKIGRTSLSANNRFLMIVNSGSKGTLINISQMISCLGQTNVDGKRIPYGFDNRTLPHFHKYDDSPGARGFIENSYISGLSAPELFFHAMGGRIGLIDTAVKSVAWNTPIVLIDHGTPVYIEIGKWIDQQLDNTVQKENVQHFTERNMELLNLPNNTVYVPTTDEDGHITWGEITAITRHDPGDQVYEIKTQAGKNVIVTESKSLLIWNPETQKLKEMLTPDIKVGDCVPVNGELCEPPIVLQSIDVSKHLSKSEFVYGTEFYKAKDMMQSAMQDRIKIPANWWNQQNGKEFTLPYTKKSALQRALTQCAANLEHVEPGFVYPYHACRKDTRIPDQFALNEENGIFIGLFLAEGNCNGSQTMLTNNNEDIRAFVREWFDKHHISYQEKSRMNKIGGTTTTISGRSSILSKFLTAIVGHKAENKHVPTDAFIAPEPFIVGLLNGYFSGDGSISKNSIDVGSASPRLIEGVAMLCSRLGIFGKVSKSQLKSNNLNTKHIKPSYRLRICSQWGLQFAKKIPLLEKAKMAKLQAIKWTKTHRNFQTYNNVILDPIVEINVMGVENHPKMYDLTIPSTLNFGLANGLQVRDTSTTGYIQRRLIKGLEDLKVEYDMTVRNSKGKIIQFAYGDDGFDSIRVENQTLPLVGMSVEDIYMQYDIIGANDQESELLSIYTKGAISRAKKQKPECRARCQAYIKKMLDARDDIVKSVFKNKNENVVRLPVAFQNIITNIQGQMGLSANSTVDLTPQEAFHLIEDNLVKINQYPFAPVSPLFEILYYFYLNPKDLLVNRRFHRKALIVLLETIALKHKEAIVNPGEMAGVIAGQSIGEPTTQLTLNSLVYAAEIIVRNSKKEIVKRKIGEFTQEQTKLSKKVDYMKDKDTTYAELSEFYEVPCANEAGETVWKRIEAATQHPVVNEDGTNTMLKVITKAGREVIATKAKSFLQLRDGKIQAVEGAALKVGDYLPASRKALDYSENHVLNLRTILPPTEYMYGSELEKAKAVMHERHWYKNHSGSTFVLPHKKSQCIIPLFKENTRQGKTPNKAQYILPGNVYMKNMSSCNYTIPEDLPLDYDFGYLVGAYAAEGSMNKNRLSIANINDAYLKPIEDYCAKLNIVATKYKRCNRGGEGWTSQELNIHSTILCRILESLCGKLSYNKFVSDTIVFSNKQCILGFLDAYIGGDGSISKYKNKDGSIRINNIQMWSTSKPLLTDVMVMLKNLGVSSHIHTITKRPEGTRAIKHVHQSYSLDVKNRQSQKLAALLNLTVEEKQDSLNLLLKQEYFKYEHSLEDLMLPDIIDGELIMRKRDDQMMDLEFDQIVSIEEVENPTPYAYDLTVEDTRNFDIYNGLCLRDTFHLAGVSSKSNVTRGVPRIEEILRLTKNPKNPSLTVYLKPMDETNQDKADAYAKMMTHTKLVDVVKSIQICFDPNEESTNIHEDRELLDQYRQFERMMEECAGKPDPSTGVPSRSKWIVRMEMDAETLLEKNITMDDIHFAISNSHYGNEISCVYSDYNMDKLVFRIRMNSSVFSKGKKRGQAETLDQSDEIYLLKNFQDTLLNNIVLRGVNHIDNVSARKVQNAVSKDDGKYVKKDIWVLDTTGSNLLDVFGLDYIDPARSYSNDIREIFDVLGIEAARQTIYNELTDVMEFSDVYINYHHTSLLCDRMTCNQDMVPIFRSGLLSDNVGPIAKATFEVHTEVFLDAARHGDFDHMRGVSANVMCGQYGHYGTSAFQLVLDMKEMETLDCLVSEKEKKISDIETAFGIAEDSVDQCSKSKIAIQNNVANLTMSVNRDAVCDDNYDAGF